LRWQEIFEVKSVVDISPYLKKYICMKTTLNIPDALIKEAKRKALDEGRSLTDLVVEGLKGQVLRRIPERKLPVSSAAGGLEPGVDWDTLRPADSQDEAHR
jgi:hypothetical protein